MIKQGFRHFVVHCRSISNNKKDLPPLKRTSLFIALVVIELRIDARC